MVSREGTNPPDCRSVRYATMFNAAKDALFSQSARAWANNQIADYGKVLSLKIDTRQKTLEVSCQLDGENSPITVKVEEYEVKNEGDRKFIQANRFSCSRPWLQKVLNDHGPARRIELPPWAAAAL
jgi:hypothetical protein